MPAWPTADTDDARVDVILTELKRTDAFDPASSRVVPTTGTGWVDPIAARSIESMYNGDTAHGRSAVLLSAQLDLVRRRQAEVHGVGQDS